MSSERLYNLSKETRIEKKEESFCKSFQKVKLVLVNIRFRLDISMLVMVTNPGIGFGGVTVMFLGNGPRQVYTCSWITMILLYFLLSSDLSSASS